MSFSSQSYGLVKATIEEALKCYIADDRSAITDIHVQLKRETGELILLNDDEVLLAHAIIDEWTGLEENRYLAVEEMLREVLMTLQNDGSLDSLSLLKPYSFVFVDEEKETIAELLLVDDQETLLLHDGLLKGLDDELNAFLRDLLEI